MHHIFNWTQLMQLGFIIVIWLHYSKASLHFFLKLGLYQVTLKMQTLVYCTKDTCQFLHTAALSSFHTFKELTHTWRNLPLKVIIYNLTSLHNYCSYFINTCFAHYFQVLIVHKSIIGRWRLFCRFYNKILTASYRRIHRLKHFTNYWLTLTKWMVLNYLSHLICLLVTSWNSGFVTLASH